MPKVTQLVPFKVRKAKVCFGLSLSFCKSHTVSGAEHALLCKALGIWAGSTHRWPWVHTPTWLSHCCIHRWRGRDRAAHRDHTLQAACHRASRLRPLDTCLGGRRRHCPRGYHMLRAHTDRLQEKRGGYSGLGDFHGSTEPRRMGTVPSPTHCCPSELGQTQGHQHFSERQRQPRRADYPTGRRIIGPQWVLYVSVCGCGEGGGL